VLIKKNGTQSTSEQNRSLRHGLHALNDTPSTNARNRSLRHGIDLDHLYGMWGV